MITNENVLQCSTTLINPQTHHRVRTLAALVLQHLTSCAHSPPLFLAPNVMRTLAALVLQHLTSCEAPVTGFLAPLCSSKLRMSPANVVGANLCVQAAIYSMCLIYDG